MPRTLSNGEIINIYYVCYGNLSIAQRQVWMLPGGPGGTSNALIDVIQELYSYDLFGLYCTTDYRGVGNSGELRCSNTMETIINRVACSVNSVTPGCLQEISTRYNLSDFYTTEAANDVIALINLQKQYIPKAEVIIYGVSFGTYWVQRIMQLENNIADKWIFDGVVLQPWMDRGGWQYAAIDANDLMIDFLLNCTKDVHCQQFFDHDTFLQFQEYMYELPADKRISYSHILFNIFISPKVSQGGFTFIINVINIFLSFNYTLFNIFVPLKVSYTLFNIYVSLVSLSSFTFKFLTNAVNSLFSSLTAASQQWESDEKRDFQHCDTNPIVYLIVKANELYTDTGIAENYTNFLDTYNQLVFDFGTKDILDTLPWINPDGFTRNYSPITTAGTILVLGGQLDVQTSPLNSVRLHQYFIDNGVNSTVLIGTNWNHGQLRYKNPLMNFPFGPPHCGYSILNQYITGSQINSACLQLSIFPTIETGIYTSYRSGDEDYEDDEDDEEDKEDDDLD